MATLAELSAHARTLGVDAGKKGLGSRGLDIDRAVELDMGEEDRHNAAALYDEQTSEQLAGLLGGACSSESETRAHNDLMAAILGKLDAAAAKHALLKGAAEADKGTCPEMTQDLVGLAHTLKTLTAEMHPAPPRALESEYEIEDFIAMHETRFYRMPFVAGSVGFKVTLRAMEGDPDLYVCQTHAKPSKAHHTWRSASEGVDVVHVLPGDAKFQGSQLFVGIHGHIKSHYRLLAAWTENKNASTSAEGGLKVKKKSAQMRVAEKVEQHRDTRRRRRLNQTAATLQLPVDAKGDSDAGHGNAQAQARVRAQTAVGKWQARLSTAARPPPQGSATRARPRARPRSSAQTGYEAYSVKKRLLREISEVRQRAAGHGRLAARPARQMDFTPAAAHGRRDVERATWVGMGDFVVTTAAGRNEYAGKACQHVPKALQVHSSLGGTMPQRQSAPTRPAVQRLMLGGHGSGQRLRDAQIQRDLEASQRRCAAQARSLQNSYIREAAVTEVGGLPLEAPVRTRHAGTRRAFQRTLREAISSMNHRPDLDNIGITEAEMHRDRQVLTARF